MQRPWAVARRLWLRPTETGGLGAIPPAEFSGRQAPGQEVWDGTDCCPPEAESFLMLHK